MLTIIGASLLVVTFFMNNSYVENNSDDHVNNIKEEFNYAYVTGVAMIGAFVASFVLFTKNKAKRGFAS